MITTSNEAMAEDVAELKYDHLCQERGWDRNTQVTVLEGFIRDKGLMRELLGHAREVVEQENLVG